MNSRLYVETCGLSLRIMTLDCSTRPTRGGRSSAQSRQPKNHDEHFHSPAVTEDGRSWPYRSPVQGRSEPLRRQDLAQLNQQIEGEQRAWQRERTELVHILDEVQSIEGKQVDDSHAGAP